VASAATRTHREEQAAAAVFAPVPGDRPGTDGEGMSHLKRLVETTPTLSYPEALRNVVRRVLIFVCREITQRMRVMVDGKRQTPCRTRFLSVDIGRGNGRHRLVIP
jgi:hypothetical protein